MEPPRRDAVAAGLAAGLAGSLAMTASTAVEMRARHRPASTAPVRAAERVTGVRLPSDRARRALSWGAHVPFGTALGLVRPLLGDRPGAAPTFFAVAWLPDLALVPAAGRQPPPWRWGTTELALSAAHHAAYAVAGEAAWRARRRLRPRRARARPPRGPGGPARRTWRWGG